jgi:hydroxymethylbilane synthase
MKTTGDKILDKTLDQIGGKGLFVKELDEALRAGEVDITVHSLKDLPAEIPEDLPVIGFSVREDPRDVLVLPEGISDISEMDFSKPIGTSSRRRTLQAQELFPQAGFESVRGNVLTRLRKLDEGQYSAIILAAAGLRRLGLENRISRVFSTEEMIPSAGQGILALQGRKGVDYSCLDGFVSARSAIAAAAERGFVSALGGGCTSPIAAHAEFDSPCAFGAEENGAGSKDDGAYPMTLRGFYYDEETCRIYRRKISLRASTPQEGFAAGRELAAMILADVKTRK